MLENITWLDGILIAVMIGVPLLCFVKPGTPIGVWIFKFDCPDWPFKGAFILVGFGSFLMLLNVHETSDKSAYAAFVVDVEDVVFEEVAGDPCHLQAKSISTNQCVEFHASITDFGVNAYDPSKWAFRSGDGGKYLQTAVPWSEQGFEVTWAALRNVCQRRWWRPWAASSAVPRQCEGAYNPLPE